MIEVPLPLRAPSAHRVTARAAGHFALAVEAAP